MSRRCGASRHPTAKQKGGWSPEEDSLLISLVKKHGEGQWSPIARALNEEMNKTESTGRIGKQCRERWNHHLCPGLRKGPWTPEEEALVVDAHRRLGNRWSDIARCIPGRSENAVKNHWNATLRKRITSENPAGPLKEYLDTLHLTVAPRRRNGGGGGGGVSGYKRKRGSRERDDSSSEESDDEGSDDEADGEKPLAAITAAPSPVRPAKPCGAGTSAGASRRPARPSKSTAATAAAVAGHFATAAVICESAGGSATTRGTATQRFPSDAAASILTEAAILPRAQGAAAGSEPAPERVATVTAAAAATSGGRRRSKRVAAQVGNERLRNLVEAEEREAAAEEEAVAEIAAVARTVSAFDTVLKVRPARCSDDSDRDVSGAAHSMKTTTESAPRVAALTRGRAGELQPSEPELLLHSRTLNTDSMSVSGLPLPETALRAPPSATGPRMGSITGAADTVRAAMATDDGDPVAPRVAAVARTQMRQCALRSVSAAAIPEVSMPVPELSFEPTAIVGAATMRPISPAVPAPAPLAAAASMPRTQGGVEDAVHAPGWPPLAHNWSTNNMQMLAAGQQARRSSYGVSMGGKVRPMGRTTAEDYGSTGSKTSITAAAKLGDANGGCPATAAAAAAAFAARGCSQDDAFLMVDLPGDVASGSDIFDLVPRSRPELTALTAPPSPAVIAGAAAAAAQWESLSPVAPPCVTSPSTWNFRMPQGVLQAPIPPNLFEAPDLGLVPGSLICSDSPLHHGVGAVALPEAVGEQQARPNVNVAMRSSGAGMTVAPVLGLYNVNAHLEAAVTSAQQIHGMDPFGCFGGGGGGDGGGCVIVGVAANSSITSVGSPLSDLSYGYGDSGTNIGDASGTKLHAGMGAAAICHGAATACGQSDGEGQLPLTTTAAGQALKRESSISGCCAMMSIQPPSQGTHLMAPFKIAAPQPMASMVEAQPASPWTPAGASCLAAPLPHTMPAAPASPIPWAVQVPPPGRTTCAPMQVPYVITPGHATALPHTAGLPAQPALPHTPPIICYGMTPLPSTLQHHVAAPATLSQQPQPQLTQALYSGTQVLHSGQMQQYHHGFFPPSYTIVHPLPAQAASALAPGHAAQPVQQQPQQNQQVCVPEPAVPAMRPQQLQQSQQHQQHAKLAEQSMIYVNPGFYYYPTASYAPYSGMISSLQCHAGSGHPAAVIMPVPMPPMEQQQPQQQQHVLMPGVQSVTRQQPQPPYQSFSQ